MPVIDYKLFACKPEPQADVVLSVIIKSPQPSKTTVFISGNEVDEFYNSKESIHLGKGSELSRKKISIMTTIQDKNNNTDSLELEHILDYGGTKPIVRTFSEEAEEEGDIHNVKTEIYIA